MKKWVVIAMALNAGGLLFADVIPRSPDAVRRTDVKVTYSTYSIVTVETAPAAPIQLPSAVNNAFCGGEKLKFAIKYEFMNAGIATMEVSDTPPIDGRPTLHIETRAESNGFVDSFFKVRDFNASTMDKDSLRSLNFHQNLKEGGYKVIRNTSIDYKTRTYTFHRVRRGTESERQGAIDRPVFDILSAFFYTRTLPLTPGSTHQISVFSDDETIEMGVSVGPKIQTIKVPAGKFECLRLDPALVSEEGIFRTKDGRMTVWVTNDARKMPVLIRSKVLIGSFDAELVEYTSCPKVSALTDSDVK